MTKNLILLSFLLISVCSFSQQLKKKRKASGDYAEEYTVLKEDKKVKHGQYIKLKKDIVDYNSIIVIGNYEFGEKSGTWYNFYSNGFIKSEGNYHNNKKSGVWKQYYKPYDSVIYIMPTLFSNRGIIFNEDGTISIDKSRSVVVSEGVYNLGMKVGAWNYYNEEGELLHKFDHNSNKLILNNVSDSSNFKSPYLGGVDRLFYEFYLNDINGLLDGEIAGREVHLLLKTNSNPIEIELIKYRGEQEFVDKIIEIIKNIENNFLGEYIVNENGEIHFAVEFVPQDIGIAIRIGIGQIETEN